MLAPRRARPGALAPGRLRLPGACCTPSRGATSLMSAVSDPQRKGRGEPPERVLNAIPSAAEAPSQQDAEAKLSQRHLDEVLREVLALHALRPLRTASHYDPAALLRVRRGERIARQTVEGARVENAYELLPYLQRLRHWLHVRIQQPTGKPPAIKLRRLPSEEGAAPAPAAPAGPRGKRRSGSADDPRQGRAAAARAEGAEGGAQSPAARRLRIQERSSKPVWRHTAAWEGSVGVQQTYGLRVRYPTLQMAVPVIRVRSGVLGSVSVESRLRLTLSTEGRILSQLWEHDGGLLFSAALQALSRGHVVQEAGTGGGDAGSAAEAAEAAGATRQVRLLLGLGGTALLGVFGVQLGASGGF